MTSQPSIPNKVPRLPGVQREGKLNHDCFRTSDAKTKTREIWLVKHNTEDVIGYFKYVGDELVEKWKAAAPMAPKANDRQA